MPRSSPLRQRIVGEARRQFFAHGLRRVTMDELAADLGLSKKTLYAHFPSKEALAEAVIQEKLAEIDGDLTRASRSSPTDVRATLTALLACADRHARELQPPWVRDMRRVAPELYGRVQSRRREIISRHFGRALARGRRAGIVRRDVSGRLVVEVLTRAIDAVVNPTVINELGVSPRAALQAVLRLFLDGALIPERRPKR